jgi:hypothetical protein
MDGDVEQVRADTRKWLEEGGEENPDVSYITEELLAEYAAAPLDEDSGVELPADEAPETADWWAYGNHFAIWPALKRCAYTTNGAGAACGSGIRRTRSYDSQCWTQSIASCGGFAGYKIWGI